MSIAIFLILNSVIGLKIIIHSINLIRETTNYHFGISTNTLDYFIFASFPIFGMLYHSTRVEFNKSKLILDIITVLLSIIVIMGIGLYLLTYLGKSSNPLIPEYLFTEPFELYSTLLIAIGIATPFLIIKLAKKRNDNNL